ncbi:MAG: Hsp20/alpha crystallin family protein [Flavobacteriales bacterium]|jgi:HSP20 family protein|nr:Hsp20/alpha crystallin family protein [Flavobacteriales bacterium]MDG1174970.1 Hsp20/alpha crystallin family protein [Flavobacteriales bacterium]|tara:strand:- start:561 stop:989 length:429 start_codon:yes stop_codon:yes gene_type:complete
MKITHNNFIPGFTNLIDEVFGSETMDTVKRNLMSQVPLANINESDVSHTIELAVPGLKKEDIKIELKENRLTISADVKKEANKENSKNVRKEFSYHSFKRSFNLPKLVDIEKIEAKNENGLLTVIIPKKEAEIKKNKLITIE